MKCYTIEEIKAAFWAEFHEAGEVWFPYTLVGESRVGCEEATEQHWQSFCEHLPKKEG